MNKTVVVVLVILAGVGVYLRSKELVHFFNSRSQAPQNVVSTPGKNTTESPSTESSSNNQQTEAVKVVTTGLDTPWAIAFLPVSPTGGPGGGMLVTERKGTVRLIDKSGKLQDNPVATIQNAREIGEGGLMGIALHPNFSDNNFIYFYYTYSSAGDNTLNRVVRMTYQDNTLSGEQTVVDQIPGASNHNGGRIKFGPDGNLYITTGDASEPSLAQDKNSLAGKVLRVTDSGQPAPGNPFNNRAYSYGHRNPQGLAWDDTGGLWETEHGPSGGSLGTGNDEVNKIEIGKNYGWPEIQGDQTKTGMEKPVKHSGRSTTWAPAGAAFFNNSLFFGGLRGNGLYQLIIQNGQAGDLKEHFKGYGRVREVILGPDKMLYISTSNKDGRGFPKEGDDKIIRIDPSKL